MTTDIRLFKVNLLGIKVTCFSQLTCFENNKCDATLFVALAGIGDIPIARKTFETTLVDVIKEFRYFNLVFTNNFTALLDMVNELRENVLGILGNPVDEIIAVAELYLEPIQNANATINDFLSQLLDTIPSTTLYKEYYQLFQDLDENFLKRELQNQYYDHSGRMQRFERYCVKSVFYLKTDFERTHYIEIVEERIEIL